MKPSYIQPMQGLSPYSVIYFDVVYSKRNTKGFPVPGSKLYLTEKQAFKFLGSIKENYPTAHCRKCDQDFNSLDDPLRLELITELIGVA